MVLGKTEVKRIMEQHDLSPSRSLGQNFVIDPNTIHRIIRDADIKTHEQIIEIGPGLGCLTSQLSLNAKVLAIELDRYLIPALESVLNQYGTRENVEIIQHDAMKIVWQDFFSSRPGNWKMVANLPYNIATPLLLKMLENAPQLEEICVMVQWEVAERFAASTRSKAYGIPSVKTQYWADVKILGKVSPNVFLPAPKVDSAILKIRRKAVPLAVDYQKFSLLVQTAFRHRRKMLRKSLIQIVESSHFSMAEINPQARPEELSVEDWINLTKSLSAGRRQ